jgi:tRNA G18 (ribose-2'-O)-methylase SpoU
MTKLTTPGTFGVIINTAVASGKIDYFLLTQKNICPPFHPFVVTASNGAIFNTRLIFCEELLNSLALLKSKEGVHIAILSNKSYNNKPQQPLFSFTPPDKVSICFSCSFHFLSIVFVKLYVYFDCVIIITSDCVCI